MTNKIEIKYEVYNPQDANECSAWDFFDSEEEAIEAIRENGEPHKDPENDGYKTYAIRKLYCI